MRGFGDFKRIAVICIPDDEELKRRIEKKIEAEGKESSRDVSEYAVNEMKGKFKQKKTSLISYQNTTVLFFFFFSKSHFSQKKFYF